MSSRSNGFLPMGMLPVRTVEAPKATTLRDCTLYEFPILGAVALADDSNWPPIVLHRGGRVLHLLKPACYATQVQAHSQISDQYLDFRYTIFKVETELVPESSTPQPLEIYPVIHELVHLLRTVARQYWIGFAMANEGSIIQGIRSRIETGIATFSGQGSFVVPFVVSPITEQSWRFLGDLLTKQAFPSTAEVMLCDALLELRRGDLLQAILLLGVACEVATMNFLEDLIARQSLSNTQRADILKKPFKQKLIAETANLGSRSPESSFIQGFPQSWARSVCELYRLRNQTAHGGTCMISDGGSLRPIELRDMTSLLFSAEALFSWVAEERIRLRIPGSITATMSPTGYPVSAMIVPGPNNSSGV